MRNFLGAAYFILIALPIALLLMSIQIIVSVIGSVWEWFNRKPPKMA